MTEKFSRDCSSGALLNTDVDSLRQYKAQRSVLKRISVLESQVAELTNRLKTLEKIDGQTD